MLRAGTHTHTHAHSGLLLSASSSTERGTDANSAISLLCLLNLFVEMSVTASAESPEEKPLGIVGALTHPSSGIVEQLNRRLVENVHFVV